MSDVLKENIKMSVCSLCKSPEYLTRLLHMKQINGALCATCAIRINELVSKKNYTLEEAIVKVKDSARLAPAFVMDFSQECVVDSIVLADRNMISNDPIKILQERMNFISNSFDNSKAQFSFGEKQDICENQVEQLARKQRMIRMTELGSTGAGRTQISEKISADMRRNVAGEKKTCSSDVRKMKPSVIKSMLDEHVIGQDAAKECIAIACHEHLKRLAILENNPNSKIQKSNILMLGPTGSGKTYMIQTLADILNIPLSVSTANDFTEAGYVGKDVEVILQKLIRSAQGDIKKAQGGIVFIDEIDKLGEGKSSGRQVGKEGVQQALLTMIAGADIEVTVGVAANGNPTDKVILDTRNILFICGGAFPALEDIIRERLESSKKEASMGFQIRNTETIKESIDEDYLKYVTTEDLKRFGMIPEFIGRLPMVCSLEALDVDAMVRILTEPKDSIVAQEKELFAYDGIDLEFSQDALETIAELAITEGTGARALRKILEEKMRPLKFSMPDREDVGKVIVTSQFLNGGECTLVDRGGCVIR